MHAEVQRYYGEVLNSSADLKTSACCTDEGMPAHAKPILAQIHDEVLTRYYGCGLILPEALEGARILDLGCGAGRDCYVLSKLAGESGFVVGVDMTPEQLDVAQRHLDFHAERFGFTRSNVEFIEGDIEKLGETGLEANSFDIIVSNCVINLATDKRAVLDQAFRLLKPGGEMYFADVYASVRIPELLRADPVLYGECLSGALYWNDFVHLAKAAGFADPRLVTDKPITVDDPELAARVQGIEFWSATYRLFALDGLEPAWEDYGQSVVYKGTLTEQPDAIQLDKHHLFPAGQAVAVCGNTWRMLRESRLAPHFEFADSDGRHRGIFQDCGTDVPFAAGDRTTASSACC